MFWDCSSSLSMVFISPEWISRRYFGDFMQFRDRSTDFFFFFVLDCFLLKECFKVWESKAEVELEEVKFFVILLWEICLWVWGAKFCLLRLAWFVGMDSFGEDRRFAFAKFFGLLGGNLLNPFGRSLAFWIYLSSRCKFSIITRWHLSLPTPLINDSNTKSSRLLSTRPNNLVFDMYPVIILSSSSA